VFEVDSRSRHDIFRAGDGREDAPVIRKILKSIGPQGADLSTSKVRESLVLDRAWVCCLYTGQRKPTGMRWGERSPARSSWRGMPARRSNRSVRPRHLSLQQDHISVARCPARRRLDRAEQHHQDILVIRGRFVLICRRPLVASIYGMKLSSNMPGARLANWAIRSPIVFDAGSAGGLALCFSFKWKNWL